MATAFDLNSLSVSMVKPKGDSGRNTPKTQKRNILSLFKNKTTTQEMIENGTVTTLHCVKNNQPFYLNTVFQCFYVLVQGFQKCCYFWPGVSSLATMYAIWLFMQLHDMMCIAMH